MDLIQINKERDDADLEDIINTWLSKAKDSEELKKQYNDCASNYAIVDKTFRITISLCVLTASFLMTSMNSEAAITSSKYTSVYYLEMMFSFAAAALSLISHVLDIPESTARNWKNHGDFDKAQKVCWDNHNHCKWVRDTIFRTCPDARKDTLTFLRQQKRDYMGLWMMLPINKKCCSCFYMSWKINKSSKSAVTQRVILNTALATTEPRSVVIEGLDQERDIIDEAVTHANLSSMIRDDSEVGRAVSARKRSEHNISTTKAKPLVDKAAEDIEKSPCSVEGLKQVFETDI